jgi:hypothetical protein
LLKAATLLVISAIRAARGSSLLVVLVSSSSSCSVGKRHLGSASLDPGHQIRDVELLAQLLHVLNHESVGLLLHLAPSVVRRAKPHLDPGLPANLLRTEPDPIDSDKPSGIDQIGHQFAAVAAPLHLIWNRHAFRVEGRALQIEVPVGEPELLGSGKVAADA